MRTVLLGLVLFVSSAPPAPPAPTADRAADRRALLAADSALVLDGAAFTDSAIYLHPGSPLVRGASQITTFLADAKIARELTHEPVFADVSLDGSLGYTVGWTRAEGTRGKYLACWRKEPDGWRLAAFAGTMPMRDSVPRAARSRRSSPTRRSTRLRSAPDLK